MDKTFIFDLTIYPENGGFIITSVEVELTEEEYESVLENYKDGYDIGDWEDTKQIHERIAEKAVREFDWESSEYDYNDLGDAIYDIEYPDEIIDVAEDSLPSESKRNLIDSDEISKELLIDREDLVEAFKLHLMENLDYTKSEAELAASDFEDPYETPYIYQEYESTIVLDDTKYEVRYCKTNYAMCGLFELAGMKPFEFYMLFDKETLPDNTVGSYIRARKKYVISNK